MFVRDFKREFYDEIQNQRVLVLVGFDIDALCACRILQYLLQCDQVVYSIVPVRGKGNLARVFAEYSEGFRHVVMINCGATFDIVETLQPEEYVIFYVFDSHRPVDIHNAYNAVQVKLIMGTKEENTVPAYDVVFRDDESDEEEESGRRRLDAAAVDRRRERRLWEEERSKILFDYTKFSYSGASVAFLMYELAWKMSRDTNELLWLAIVGVTEQYLLYKTPRDKYMEDVISLQAHVSRHNKKTEDEEGDAPVSCLRITFDDEMQLCLYRHWTLFESLCHSIPTACQFRIWSPKGMNRLHEFLAEMGLPLAQCKQHFSAMDSELRGIIKTRMQEHMQKYGLNVQNLIIPAFTVQHGYRNKLSASDVVYATIAVLESVDPNKIPNDCFLEALDILQRMTGTSTENAIEVAKTQVRAMVTQVTNLLHMRQVLCAGPFLYAFLQEGRADEKFFLHPLCLSRLARFTLEAHCAGTRNRKAFSLPMVVGAPYGGDKDTMIVVGIPPLQVDDERKNFFGKAFEQAGKMAKTTPILDHFDSHIIEVKVEDKTNFFDALMSLLA